MTKKQYDKKSEADDSRKKLPLEKLLIFIFGLFFLITELVIALVFPEPSNFQYTIFRIILALAAGGIAALIPGLIDIKIGGGAKFVLRASGAIAVFVIVYFYSPATLVPNPAKPKIPAHSAQTNGDFSPIFQGDVNNSNIEIGGKQKGNKQ
jgi:hypothetical protein